MKSAKPMEYTRAPLYGSFKGMTATGKEDYIDLMTTELTYNENAYKMGELLGQTIRNQITIDLHEQKLKHQARKIKRLEEENKTMKQILIKLNNRLKKIEGENTIL